MQIKVQVTEEELEFMGLSVDSLEEQIIDRLDSQGTDLAGYTIEIQML